MIIREIKLYNFGIYSGEQSLMPFVQSKDVGKPVTLVGGYNGRGKTSILEAVLLALYGIRSPKVREKKQSYSAYLEGLIHSQGQNDSSSWVELTIELPGRNESVVLNIRRSWQVANVRAVDRLTVWRNGMEDKYLADNWEAYVEELVPQAISELFFFDGEKISALAETDETVESLQRAIRSLLGLEVVDRVIKDLSLVVRKNQQSIEDPEMRKEIEKLQFENEALQIAYEKAELDIETITGKIDAVSELLEELETAYFKAGGNILQSREQLTAERDEKRETLNALKVELGTLAAGALPLSLVKDQLSHIWSISEEDKKLTTSKLALPLLVEHNNVLLKELEVLKADERLLQKIEQFLSGKNEEFVRAAEQEPVLGLSFATQGQLKDLVYGGFDALISQTNDLKMRFEVAEFELEQIERHLVIDVDKDNTAQLKEDRNRTRQELVELELRKAKLKEESAAISLKLKQNESEIRRIGGELANADVAERIIGFATKSQETMRVFRERLSRKKIEKLANSVFEAFDLLTHKSTLVHRINIDPDTLRISLMNEDGREISKGRLSSGERQMLAIAIMWGLGRAAERTLPVIIDTPMGRLDSLHRMSFVNEYLPEASHQVIVLSTDTEITGRYYDSLQRHIGAEYLLKYNEQERSTSIVRGYFDSVEE